MRLILAWLALLAALIGAPAAALQQPSSQLPARPAGPVYDGANVIAPADEAQLDQRLRAYNQATGRAVIVATVPSLNGQEIETYANELARTWDIGGTQTEQGLLFLVAPSERQLRIETARGLDERMTDIMSGRIIRDVVVPRFKAGDMSGGIVAGVDAIIKQLDMDPAQAKAVEEAEAARRAQQGHEAAPAIAGMVFWVVIILFFVMLASRRRAGRRYHGGGIGGLGNVIMWSAINSAMNSGRSHGGGWSSGGGGFGGGGGGFGGFGGGGGGFSGGGASGSW